ncbi:MalY/PatB family protein [Zafaria sp. J156]|uniref:MalY/PatB family protein n=1 Tax=Zafaria sp. J156 TaxID=3116490 RepID=UPI002E77FC50|nr:aminotransferase class I/II-fold pyridoxal phosphate-dependent enzyme [Zafaria sp. J156]MEE1619821.1 aminotransferase class I/II-fold pyridoxal phosphate-dependent enzyme [Zafaria sp. J156]
MDAHPFDHITSEELRRRGSLKWTGYPEMLGAWVAEMDFGTAPGVIEAAQETVASGMLGYAPPRLVRNLRESTAAWLAARFGWEVDDDAVRPVPTVLSALVAAILHFSPAHRPEAPVVFLTPAYPGFLDVPSRLGRRSLHVEMVAGDAGWEVDWAALEEALRGGALLILVNPHNPLGKVYAHAELERICDLVDATGSRVFADEVHAPLVYDGATHLPYASLGPTAAGHTLTAVSASKAFNLPGLKCAQVVLGNDLDRLVWGAVGSIVEDGTANVGLAATAAAYDGGAAWLAGVVDYLDGSRRRLEGLVAEHLPAARYVAPEGTYLAWLDVSRLMLGRNPARFFRHQAGVATVGGTDCGEAGRGYVRLNFATPRPVLEAIVHRMGAAVDGCDPNDSGDLDDYL